MEVGDKVIVIPTNGIGQIIDKGTDSIGTWYRTDVDGVRSLEELRPYEGSLEESNIKLHKLTSDLHSELSRLKQKIETIHGDYYDDVIDLKIDLYELIK